MSRCMLVEMQIDDGSLELVRKTTKVWAFDNLGPISQQQEERILARSENGVNHEHGVIPKHPIKSILRRGRAQTQPQVARVI